VSLERIHRLVHQCHSVSQEQHPLGPVATHQQVGEANHRARLAGASGHHQQGLAVVVLLEGLGNAANTARLIEALDNRWIDLGLGEGFATAPPLNGEL
jgi:hypothetical protein